VLERRRIRVRGVVQGVGYRPFVHGLATRSALAGHVLNDGEGVLVEAEGERANLDAFVAALQLEAPPLARVSGVVSERITPLGEQGFEIAESMSGTRRTLVPPDVATCDDCLRELFDPADRRYRYPFVTCTNCGPRFTITRSVPYDRHTSTMAGFELCAYCRREFEDPTDRRFHAVTNACPDCGPRLSMPLEEAVGLLRAGAIVAVKGLGGYHLACDAASESAVARLRARKQRDEKPFAILTATPEALAKLAPDEFDLLHARERPIVLVHRRADAGVANGVAPGTDVLGLMLPYTPLHHLLAHDFSGPLVLTSGNVSDEPIAFTDEDAHRRLGAIADAFLGHDRPIHRRCEDSVVRGWTPIRRSRGYAPAGLPLPAATVPIVAAGADLKSAFCVTRAGEAFLSPHLGDLESEAAHRAFRDDLALYLAMLDVEPQIVAHDLHPEYFSTKWAVEQDGDLVGVQHHHAHAAACLAEHGEAGPALALIFDGTGLGLDGTLWGGEVLLAKLATFDRLRHLDPVPLPGGAAAIREPWRLAALHLERGNEPVPWPAWVFVRESLKLQPALTSGMGRLFDAVSALLGLGDRTTYDGQAAIRLEQAAGELAARPYAWRFGDPTELVLMCQHDIRAGRSVEEIAARFHETIAESASVACAELAGPSTVVLSGGSFQNARLLASTRDRLERRGFRVLAHRVVPPNDGGIGYGQAAVAAARIASCA
jgi:hydrogenase maturation protein HypF